MSPSPINRLQLRGRLTRGAAWLVGIVAVSFVITLFAPASARASIYGAFLLTPYELVHDWKVWKLATTSIVYPPNDVVGFLVDGLMLFMFVPVLERWWGTKRFIIFVIATSLVANLVAAIVGQLVQPLHPIWGLSPFIYASIVAFGVLFAEQPVQLFGVVPIKGKSLAIGAAGLQLVVTVLDKQWVRGAGAFAAMGLAYVMTTGVWTPNLWWLQFKRWRVRRKLGVLDGGAGSGEKKPDKQKWVN